MEASLPMTSVLELYKTYNYSMQIVSEDSYKLSW